MSKLLSFRCFVLFMSLLICSTLWSQVVVERSKDKVVIAGETYYLHSVKKGETVYSISKAYGISTDDLAMYNNTAANGLKEGQSLKIPVRLVSNSVPALVQPEVTQELKHDNNKFIYHKLQPGETVYYLSKTYGVTKDEIIQSNPGIDITKLSLGTEIAVPRKAGTKLPQQDVTVKRDPDAYYHKVTRGETMATIAEQYGLSTREVRRANKDIRYPQVGDYVKIPGKKAPAKIDVETPAHDSIPKVTETTVNHFEKPSGYTTVKNLKGSLNIAVLLPFYLAENSRKVRADSTESFDEEADYKPDDWIYPRSIGFIEMYEGILLAADTLRSLGLDVNIHAFDIASDTIEATRLIRSGKLEKMDLIIGPVHSRNLAIVASYAGHLGIPVVSPVPLINNSVLINNPTLFMAVSSLDIAQKAIAGKLADYYKDNFVIVHSGLASGSQDIEKFKSMIRTELSKKIPGKEKKIREMVFYNRSGTDSITRLSDALSENTENVVVIASEDAPVMSETIMNAHNLSRRYNMKVFGYPYMRNLESLNPKDLFELGMMIYSSYWIDYTRPDIKQFNADFKSKFFTQPSELSYAWQGYDIAYYFISGLAIHGKQFIKHPEMHNPDLLQTEFDFRRSANGSGFENQKLYLIRYANSYELELADEANAIAGR